MSCTSFLLIEIMANAFNESFPIVLRLSVKKERQLFYEVNRSACVLASLRETAIAQNHRFPAWNKAFTRTCDYPKHLIQLFRGYPHGCLHTQPVPPVYALPLGAHVDVVSRGKLPSGVYEVGQGRQVTPGQEGRPVDVLLGNPGAVQDLVES